MLRDRCLAEEVDILLPGGERPSFRIYSHELTENSASCHVIKDAGDDPDITNGAEIHARLSISRGESRGEIIIEGGTGIGRVTKPGLAIPPGEWAINPVPRQMIIQAVQEVFPVHLSPFTFHLLLSIPDGQERARKTLNERLGIVGGLSILGTTGIVRPVSAQAWTDTIDTAIDVALASGSSKVLLSTGRSSELVAQQHLCKAEMIKAESFVMMGDFFGHSVRACAVKGVGEVVVVGQFAKLLKMACGHEQTHVNSSALDLDMLSGWLERDPVASQLAPIARGANTARQLLVESNFHPRLVELVCGRVKRVGLGIANLPGLKVFLAGYHGEVLYFG
jgi:cobalt-precorrin-5B (C1)-methyltransferase